MGGGGGAGGSVACQLQACNGMHIGLGLTAVILAGTQFSQFKLENYQQIDFRLLNWIHVLTGFLIMPPCWEA